MVNKERLVFGVGRNNADYVIERKETIEVNGERRQKVVWRCTYYRSWANMLERCYSNKYQERHPSYKGCRVAEEWLLFSNFRDWMVEQDCEGKQLDKDLLFEGNKVYSSGTCVFVPHIVNSFTTERCASRGEWLIGASWHKGMNKFQSRCSNPFTKKREHLGYFDYEQDAHEAWLKRKLELAYELAAIQTDPRVAKALITRYLNYKS